MNKFFIFVKKTKSIFFILIMRLRVCGMFIFDTQEKICVAIILFCAYTSLAKIFGSTIGVKSLSNVGQDIKESSQFNPAPIKKIKSRLRLKEEILRGDAVGSKIYLFNNAILDAVPLDDLFDQSFSSVCKLFPGLGNCR